MKSPPLLTAFLVVSLMPPWTMSGDYTLGMDSETSCTKTHYYKAGDIFTASANGALHGGRCPLEFIQSGMYGDDSVEPCLSLCVKIITYTIQSCNIEVAYHDGLQDYTPTVFNCRNFPPIMWCSSTNDLKVTVSEIDKNHRDKDYAITLEVRPFCGSLDIKTTDAGVVAVPKEEPKVMNRTALIVGAVVGTVSILFVMAWTLYCYKRHRNEDDTLASEQYQQERRYRSNTPTQQTNRYAPVSNHAPACSQWSSDTRVVDPYPSYTDAMYPGGAGEVNKPFHQVLQPQLSNSSHMTGSDPWYQRSAMGPGVMEKGPSSAPQLQQMQPGGQNSQYLLQNQVYNYPQFNAVENSPADTRFVVYDFDYPAPRKYSGGKMSMVHARDSPIDEVDRLRFRELTPNRDRPRPMPQIDSTTTDHTSDNDDSSYSITTEDETTTDDQMSPVKGNMYNIAPPFGYGSMVNRDPNLQFYNHSNFLPAAGQRGVNPNIRDVRLNAAPGQVNDQRRYVSTGQNLDSNVTDPVPSANNEPSYSVGAFVPKEGPRPQVPGPQVPSPQVPPMPMSLEKLSPSTQTAGPQSPPPAKSAPLPRNVETTPGMTTKSEELPWPHNPPPAYAQTDDDSDEAQII